MKDKMISESFKWKVIYCVYSRRLTHLVQVQNDGRCLTPKRKLPCHDQKREFLALCLKRELPALCHVMTKKENSLLCASRENFLALCLKRELPALCLKRELPALCHVTTKKENSLLCASRENFLLCASREELPRHDQKREFLALWPKRGQIQFLTIQPSHNQRGKR